MLVILKNTSGVLMQSFFPCVVDQPLPVFNGKDELNMYLCIGVGHDR
jgi:hypothetical protein